MATPVSSEKCSFEASDRIEALAPQSLGSSEKRQPVVTNAIPRRGRSHLQSKNPVLRKIFNLIRIAMLLSAVGYYFTAPPDSFLSALIKNGIKSVQEWRHHPYTLPEFYSLCTRDDRGIYTSEAGNNEWAQCVTVQNGTIVDIGDISKLNLPKWIRKALL